MYIYILYFILSIAIYVFISCIIDLQVSRAFAVMQHHGASACWHIGKTWKDMNHWHVLTLCSSWARRFVLTDWIGGFVFCFCLYSLLFRCLHIASYNLNGFNYLIKRYIFSHIAISTCYISHLSSLLDLFCVGLNYSRSRHRGYDGQMKDTSSLKAETESNFNWSCCAASQKSPQKVT